MSGRLPSDRVHEPIGLDKTCRVDFVPFPLGRDAVSDGLGDLPIFGTAPEEAADVGFLERQTGNCAACRQR